MVKEEHPESVKDASTSVLPVWLDAFKVLLNLDPKSDIIDASNWDGLAVRIQVIKVRSSAILFTPDSSLLGRLLKFFTLHSPEC